jgi:hypothetical protein
MQELLHYCHTTDVPRLRSHRLGDTTLRDDDGRRSSDVEADNSRPDVFLYTVVFGKDVTIDTVP